jgi:CheY-like chemotaxis protein
MRSLLALISCASILVVSSALAETRVFIIPNQADGYGIDQCLAKGEKCGAHAARSYCQSRDFAQATSYRRIDPDEITGAVPMPAGGKCSHAGCNEYVSTPFEPNALAELITSLLADGKSSEVNAQASDLEH